MKLTTFLLLVLAPSLLAADGNWPQWRGPDTNGLSASANPPTRWSATENITWKTPLPGKGHSSPIVFGNRIYLTTAIEDKLSRQLLCLDKTTGKILFEKEILNAPLEKKHQLNSYASPTPATDGERVYVTSFAQPNSWLVCYDIDGKELWRKSPGSFRSMHGWATAPMLYKELVIVNSDQDAQGFLVAYDKTTGEEKWRTDRPNKTRSYTNPLFVEAAGKMQMILTGSKCTASYNPDTGQQYWIVDGPTEQFVGSPVYTDGVLFATGGFPTFHLIGIDPSKEGDISKSGVLWHHKNNGAYVPSPIAVNHLFFVVSDEGRASCLEPKSGNILWSEQLGRHHRPSPVSANGLLYFLSDDGDCHVIKAEKKFELVATNALGEQCNSSPALSGGQMFIRTDKHLFCIGK